MDLLRYIGVLALTACFSPRGRDCAVTCSSAGGCPTGWVCLDDTFCHESATEELCNAGAPDAPTMMTITLEAVADTYVLEVNAADNYGADETLSFDATAGTMRVALVRFDLSSIPSGAVIEAPPRLQVCTTATPATAATLDVFPVLEQWSEGLGIRQPDETGSPGVANWNERMAGTAWTNLGVGAPTSRGAIVATVGGASFTPIMADTPYTVDIELSVLNQWLADPATNFGLALVPQAGTTVGTLVSREAATAPCRPQLFVTHKLFL